MSEPVTQVVTQAVELPANQGVQTKLPFWNRLSTRLSLLIVLIVLVLTLTAGILFFRFEQQLEMQGVAQSILRRTVGSALINLVAVFLFTIIGATVFSRTLLTEPIIRLSEATRAVASGRLGVTLPVKTRDEIGVLSEAFNTMSTSLASRTEELVQANKALKESEAKLELRVRERTAELIALLELSNSIALTTEDMPLVESILDELHDITEYQSAALFALQGETHFSVFLTRGELSRQDNKQMLAALTQKRVLSLTTRVGEETLFPITVRDKPVGVLVLEHDQAHGLSEEKERLVMAFAAQAGVAIENIRLFANVTEKAAFEERQHLARELHDSVSQALYSIVLGSHAARKQLKTRPAEADKALEYVQDLAEAGLAEMRALIFELRPEVLEQEGLSAALAKQVEALEVRHKLKTEFVADQEPELPFHAKQALFRIAQEALHNIVKHAHAKEVSVSLTESDAEAQLCIEDDGVGFDTSQTYSDRLGLTSMRERAASLGGTFSMTSEPESGTRLCVNVPRQVPL